MSKSESGSGKVVFVRGFKQESGKTTFDILAKLKKKFPICLRDVILTM